MYSSSDDPLPVFSSSSFLWLFWEAGLSFPLPSTPPFSLVRWSLLDFENRLPGAYLVEGLLFVFSERCEGFWSPLGSIYLLFEGYFFGLSFELALLVFFHLLSVQLRPSFEAVSAILRGPLEDSNHRPGTWKR